jgi:hypothetical protein
VVIDFHTLHQEDNQTLQVVEVVLQQVELMVAHQQGDLVELVQLLQYLQVQQLTLVAVAVVLKLEMEDLEDLVGVLLV